MTWASLGSLHCAPILPVICGALPSLLHTTTIAPPQHHITPRFTVTVGLAHPNSLSFECSSEYGTPVVCSVRGPSSPNLQVAHIKLTAWNAGLGRCKSMLLCLISSTACLQCVDGLPQLIRSPTFNRAVHKAYKKIHRIPDMEPKNGAGRAYWSHASQEDD